jgi:hypothetical protein
MISWVRFVTVTRYCGLLNHRSFVSNLTYASLSSSERSAWTG